MAITATLGVDTSMVLSGQKITLALTLVSAPGTTPVNITRVVPYVTPAASSYNLGRPTLITPEAPVLLAAGSTFVLQWTEALFKGQDLVQQANSPTGAYPVVLGCLVYYADGTTQTPATVTVYVFPPTLTNANTALTLPTAGAANLAYNADAWLAGVLSSAPW